MKNVTEYYLTKIMNGATSGLLGEQSFLVVLSLHIISLHIYNLS